MEQPVVQFVGDGTAADQLGGDSQGFGVGVGKRNQPVSVAMPTNKARTVASSNDQSQARAQRNRIVQAAEADWSIR